MSLVISPRLTRPECRAGFRNLGHLGLHRLRAHGVVGTWGRGRNRGRSKPQPKAPTLAQRREAKAARTHRRLWQSSRPRSVIRPNIHARFAAILARVDATVAAEVSERIDVEEIEEAMA